MNVGDKVGYLPDLIHARQRHPQHGFPVVFGWKTGKKLQEKGSEPKDEVVELNDAEARMKLRHIRKQDVESGRAHKEAKRLVVLRVRRPWQATVRKLTPAVVQDGKEKVLATADLDILDETTGATLHYDGVPVDEGKTTPHTCHTLESKTVEAPIQVPTVPQAKEPARPAPVEPKPVPAPAQ
jgi:hypothetical protein